MGVARRRKGVCETREMGNRDWDGEDRSDPTACRNVEISSNRCDPASAGMREALRLAISRSQ